MDEQITKYLQSFNRIKSEHHFHGLPKLPRMEVIKELAEDLVNLFFPGCNCELVEDCTLEIAVRDIFNKVFDTLSYEMELAFDFENNFSEKKVDPATTTKEVILKLKDNLGSIRELIKSDAKAGFDGDPAAKGLHEVILLYPGLKAILIHRVANFLYQEKVPLIPRMLNEYVHRETGIDIHPGAKIGKGFFIDHGTGVVIGETTIIGDYVKLYQGVTLGALSFPKDSCGMLLRDTKRHPTIGNHVTIYANATVLGDIRVGNNCTIGSSAWVKESIDDYTRVIIAEPEVVITQKKPR